jgi:hypothetical protein
MSAPAASGETLSETIPVREAHRFDTTRLAELVGDKLGEQFVELRQMRGGQSNPTFLVVTSAGEYVLRKQPPANSCPPPTRSTANSGSSRPCRRPTCRSRRPCCSARIAT